MATEQNTPKWKSKFQFTTLRTIQSTHVLAPLIAFTLEVLLRLSKALLIDTTLHQHPDYIHPFRFLDFSRLPIPSFAEANTREGRRIYGKCKVEIMQSFVSTNPSIQTQSVPDRNKTFLYPVPVLKMPWWLCGTNGAFVTGWTWCFSDILHFPINHASSCSVAAFAKA